MTKKDTIAIIGGDARQRYLYYVLCDKGYSVWTFSVDKINDSGQISELLPHCSIVILPIPFTKDKTHIYTCNSSPLKIDYILSLINVSAKVYGGCFNQIFRNTCCNKDISIDDFMDNDSFEIGNSIATAEGAIAEAILSSPVNIHMSYCLILGYGKCGTAIANRLKSLNAITSVCARNTIQLSKAFECGHRTFYLNSLSKIVNRYDFIFNTIPAPILNHSIINKVKKDVTIIDIASNPGGTDFEACKYLGINAKLCLSLPGKYSPKASSQIIYKCL